MKTNISENVFTLLGIVCFAIMLLSGCQTPPMRAMTEQDLYSRHPIFIRSYQNDLEEMATKSENRIRTEYNNAKFHTDSKPQSYDVLVLSGGGAFGAFGAGFLYGWGEVKDKEFKRPQFDTE